jgi:hypothetical protein
MRWLWRSLLRILGLLRRSGKGNKRVVELLHRGQSGWVEDVTGVVIWIKPEDESEQCERRRRMWRHLWRLLLETFGSRPDHSHRYVHQIFLIELEEADGLVVRIENNISSGKPLRKLKKGLRVEVGGEYIPNQKGGKIHHTHGHQGYVRRR